MAKKEVAIRKRQKITSAHKTMLIVVSLCAIITSSAIVGSGFMFRRMAFNNKVINERAKAVKKLKLNKKTLEDLKSKVNVLKTDPNLTKTRINQDQLALRVISDALPDRPNSVALGSSLKNKILTIAGTNLKEISIASTEEETDPDFSSTDSGSYRQEYDDVDSSPIYFSFELLGTAQSLRESLQNLERSIRPMYVDKVEFKGGDSSQSIVVSGRSFYEQELKVDNFISEKTIKDE